MIIEDKKVGVLVYKIHLENADGEILEQSTIENPRAVVFGLGNIMPSFEKGLRGLKSGEKFTFTIPSEDAFGNFHEDLIMDVPKDAFMADGVLREDLIKIGNVIPMMDNNGHPFEGVIKSIKEDAIEMDFNHPLVGKSLFVTGEVLNVREATDEEMTPHHSCCGSGHSCCNEDDPCCSHDHQDGGCCC